ncbi:MAG: hypothetical protein M0Z53_05670 [Thermaerobacter sp.]|nr:hypothetical protein [Thermaerobacter sp.]
MFNILKHASETLVVITNAALDVFLGRIPLCRQSGLKRDALVLQTALPIAARNNAAG